jgi:hypothetical protein
MNICEIPKSLLPPETNSSCYRYHQCDQTFWTNKSPITVEKYANFTLFLKICRRNLVEYDAIIFLKPVKNTPQNGEFWAIYVKNESK